MSRKLAGEGDAGRDGGSANGAPRWVKVFGIVALALVLTLVVLRFAIGGDHGPGRHTREGGNSGRHEPPAGLNHEVQQP